MNSMWWFLLLALLVFFITYDPCKGNLHHYFVYEVPAPEVTPMINKQKSTPYRHNQHEPTEPNE